LLELAEEDRILTAIQRVSPDTAGNSSPWQITVLPVPMESEQRRISIHDRLNVNETEAGRDVFPSWEDLLRFLSVSDTTGWIFRGQPDESYALKTRLERELQSAGYHPKRWPDAERAAIGHFKSVAASQLPTPPQDKDLLGWLFLMQHYGAPTRLLDWTTSPFVACYFAYAEPPPAKMKKENSHRVLWMLHAQACRIMYGYFRLGIRDHLGTEATRSVDKDGKTKIHYPGVEEDWSQKDNELVRCAIRHAESWPLPISPPQPDPRMLAQQAAFTCDCSLAAPVDHLRDKSQWRAPSPPSGAWIDLAPGQVFQSPPGAIIYKIRLPEDWRQEVIRNLYKMGITPASLFPGVDGVGQATRLRIQTGDIITLLDLLGM
jgi:hypothetical protein